MTKAERRALGAIPLILAIGAAIAWAGSQGGVRAGGWPVFAWCALLSFAINAAVFVPSYLARTERYFDLTGSATYVALCGFALALSRPDPRALLIAALVAVWAVRLGSFLFIRVSRDGGDGRFDRLKHSLPRFAMTWTLQGLWVLLTAACAFAAITGAEPVPLGAWAAAGAALWAAGFAIEVAADAQKRRFRANPANRDRWIDSGLWAWSRHPNYFGEIALWTGIALIALPALRGWQHLTLISPVFVAVLLTRISGIPLLEARANKRWGESAAYRSYRDRTSALLPRPPQRADPDLQRSG